MGSGLLSVRKGVSGEEALRANLNASGFCTFDTFIDALTATARPQSRDWFFTHNPREASVARALDLLAGRSCTAIPTGQAGQSLVPKRTLLSPERPSAAQREVPGLF